MHSTNRTLGGFYLKRAALTGNIGDYVQATEILDGALALAPGHPQTMRLLASSALAVHDFGRALWLADSLLDSDPNDADSLLIASDANLELGRTDVALTIINKLTLLAPDHPAPYIRQAEIAHLSGDQAGAIALAELAYGNARSLGFEGRNLAFYALFQADLVLDIGEYDHAGGLVQEALTFAPEWAQAPRLSCRRLNVAGAVPRGHRCLRSCADPPAGRRRVAGGPSRSQGPDGRCLNWLLSTFERWSKPCSPQTP